MLRIEELTRKLGLGPDAVEPYGWHRGKFTLEFLSRLPPPRAGAKYINVTAISPTPFGEGKTVTSISLSMGLWKTGRSSIVALRQPSMAPVFGVKGGGAGGGKASLVPLEDLNLHFTGDLHAVTAANNLLAALIDNHVKRKLTPPIEMGSISWRRAMDVSDKALSHIEVGLDGGFHGPRRETGFDLTAASEIMAILALAKSFPDLIQRLEKIQVGKTPDGVPVSAKDIRASGAIAAVMRDAFRPNLVQTIEGTPALLHAGPFANIGQGNSSVVADRLALTLVDYVVTESGFGSDCGAEKFFHIKCRQSGLSPNVEVLVCTVRALKWHSGKFGTKSSTAHLMAHLNEPDLEAVKNGSVNLIGHIENLKQFGVPIVVAINQFPTDTEEELQAIRDIAMQNGVEGVALCKGFTEGGAGSVALAEAVAKASEKKSVARALYDLEDTIEEKLNKLAVKIYGARGIELSSKAQEQVAELTRLGMGSLPVCIAKTQYSFSHDPELLGRPRDFIFPIREIGPYAGAGFLYALSGTILTMPGLPPNPSAWNISVDENGNILGLK